MPYSKEGFYIHRKHVCYLSEEGLNVYRSLTEKYDIDPDLAFELVEMGLGEERAYDICPTGLGDAKTAR